MVRKLKYHEQKLLKKVDFISWEVDQNLHEVKVLRRFHIEKREDYTKSELCSRVCSVFYTGRSSALVFALCSIQEAQIMNKLLNQSDCFRENCSRTRVAERDGDPNEKDVGSHVLSSPGEPRPQTLGVVLFVVACASGPC
ncbi:UNVERIFIED_CONTAM: hypothetical protein FKN15_027684 [Acipenser sinensis]